MHVSLAGRKSDFGDRVSDLVQGEVMDGPRFGDHILFDHQAAHIVSPELQRDLSDF